MRRQLVVLLLFVIAGLAVYAAGSAAQAPGPGLDFAPNLYTLLGNLREADSAVTLNFAEPMMDGNRSVTVNAQAITAGVDYLCYSEPWNDGLRYHCTPYNNVVGFSFIDQPES